MKRNMMLLMIALLALSWYTTVKNVFDRSDEYTVNVEQAKHNDSKGMYEAAIENYQIALKYKPDDLGMRIAEIDDYLRIGQDTDFVNACKDVINEFDAHEETIEKLMNYYRDKNKYSDALPYLHTLMKEYPDREYIKDVYNSMKGAYQRKNNTFNWVGDFFQGYASCRSDEEHYGSVNKNDTVVIGMRYKWSGPYIKSFEGSAVALENGGYGYVNKKGNSLLIPDIDVSYIGVINGDKMLIQDHASGKFGYIDTKLNNLTELVYDDATAFVSNTAAVKQGGKWAILDSSMKPKTEFIYDDVVMDGNRVASRGGVFWVRIGDKYQLIDQKGEALTDAVYEDARPFATTEPSAAKKNGAWGFVDRSGKEITEFSYEDALSFGAGFAPIKDDGFWKYIDTEGRVCIEDDFTGAKAFDQSGVAFVQQNSSYWYMIDLIDKD